MPLIYYIIVFLFGGAVGSFINVIADRHNTGLSFLKGRSFCFSCNTSLRSIDLFPIFSFLFLRGKCRYCHSKINYSTFLIEILMGALSLLAFFKSGLFLSLTTDYSPLTTINYLLLLSIFATILLISIYDLRHFIIPDSFLIAFFFLAFIHNSYFIIQNSLSYLSIFPSFLAGLLVTLPFLLIFLISKGRWLGFGDVKYIAVIGFWLGVANGISAVILAFWIGAAFALFALLLNFLKSHFRLPIINNNLTIKSEIPFGPFLSIGIIISFYFNADLFQIHNLFQNF